METGLRLGDIKKRITATRALEVCRRHGFTGLVRPAPRTA